MRVDAEVNRVLSAYRNNHFEAVRIRQTRGQDSDKVVGLLVALPESDVELRALRCEHRAQLLSGGVARCGLLGRGRSRVRGLRLMGRLRGSDGASRQQE